MNNSQKNRVVKVLQDIRFWIFLFFIIRLFGITDAPLEMSHNWRQSLTNMIARNFLEVSPNMLYPRIDMAGEHSGILGSEFPLFSYLIFISAKLFGYEHWYGRLINLVVSSISMYYFYLIVKKYFSEKPAFNATIILSVSIWFSFSRKIMPDTFSVSLVIIGLYYCFRYLESGGTGRLLLFFVFNTIGILCKIPALSLMSVLAIPMLSQFPLNRKVAMLITGSVSFAIVAAWYFYWVPFLVDTYHFKLFFPKGILEGISEILNYPMETFDKFMFTSFYSYAAFIIFIAGLILMFVKKERLLIAVFSVTSLVFLVFMIKTGDVFSLHNYYIIPYTPVMALIAGYALLSLKTKWQYILLFLIGFESLANQSYDFFIKDSEKYKLKMEASIEGIIPVNEKIIVNGSQSPQTIYYLHRKGWTVSTDELFVSGFIQDKMDLGAKYLVIDKHVSEKKFAYPIIYRDNDIAVYKLENQ